MEKSLPDCLLIIPGKGFFAYKDTNGSQYDKNGNIANWWIDADRKAFNEKSAKLVSYFDKVTMFDGSKYNGNLIQGEAVADMGGMKAALTYAAGKENFDYDKFFRAATDIRSR